MNPLSEVTKKAFNNIEKICSQAQSEHDSGKEISNGVLRRESPPLGGATRAQRLAAESVRRSSGIL